MTAEDDDLLDRPVDLGFLPRLWPFVRPYRRAFAGSLALLLVSFCIELAGPWLMRAAIDGPMRDASATHDLAVLADLLDGWTNFHVRYLFFTAARRRVRSPSGWPS